MNISKNIKISILLAVVVASSGCAAVGRTLNPFYGSPPPEAFQGERTDAALNSATQKEDSARAALEAMSTYRATVAPKPTYPVMQPAMVRLMWVPDHVNKHGDLVPAHYYYLKVLGERWAVQDAFELEGQLNAGTSKSSALPYIVEGK